VSEGAYREYRGQSDAMSILLFGNRGYMSCLLPRLVDRYPGQVIGLCTRRPRPQLRHIRKEAGYWARRIGLRSGDDFIARDPFGGLHSPMKLARRFGVPTKFSDDLKSPGFARWVESLSPDLVLVAGFHRLIPKSIFSQARVAAINFHPSLLPKHRGGTPNRWVVKNGETATGWTAHEVEDKFDTGRVLASREVVVSQGDTWGDVETKLCSHLPDFATNLLERILVGSVRPVEQSASAATYEPSLSRGQQTVDWQMTAQEVRRLCFAVRPKSGALARFRGQPVCLWEVQPCDRLEGGGQPGTVVAISETGCPIVSCGDISLEIKSILRLRRVLGSACLHAKVGERFEGK